MRTIKTIRFLVVVLVCAATLLAGSADSTAAVADSSGIKAKADALNKQLIVPKAKTNWSKIKDLFM